jgi:hypothetical protein
MVISSKTAILALVMLVSPLALLGCGSPQGGATPSQASAQQAPATGAVWIYSVSFNPTAQVAGSVAQAGTLTATYNGSSSYRGQTLLSTAWQTAIPGQVILPQTTYYTFSGAVFLENANVISSVPCPPLQSGPAETIFTQPVSYLAAQSSSIPYSQFYCSVSQGNGIGQLSVVAGGVTTIVVPAGSFLTQVYNGSMVNNGSTETFTIYVAGGSVVRSDLQFTSGSQQKTATLQLISAAPASVILPPPDLNTY